MQEVRIEEELYQRIEMDGLTRTIKRFFGAGTVIQLPFSESACNTQIEVLGLSTRSYNCLKRAGINTVSGVVGAMMEDRLWAIRSLGRRSIAEIHVSIYEFGYNSLTERGRKDFIKRLLESNQDKIDFSGKGETDCGLES